jgi:hypothetical protein
VVGDANDNAAANQWSSIVAASADHTATAVVSVVDDNGDDNDVDNEANELLPRAGSDTDRGGD